MNTTWACKTRARGVVKAIKQRRQTTLIGDPIFGFDYLLPGWIREAGNDHVVRVASAIFKKLGRTSDFCLDKSGVYYYTQETSRLFQKSYLAERRKIVIFHINPEAWQRCIWYRQMAVQIDAMMGDEFFCIRTTTNGKVSDGE